nr:CotH kinase family protein [Tissierella sp.]
MKTTKYSKQSGKSKLFFLGLVIFAFVAMVNIYLNPHKEELDIDAISSSNPPHASEIIQNNLPIVIIDTNGQQIEGNTERKEVVINGIKRRLVQPSKKYNVNFKLYEPNFYGYTSIDEKAVPSLESNATINVRGQSSLKYEKKQYTLRLVDEGGLKNPQEILGMSSHDKWVLNGMYSDKSLIRNYLAYKMGRQVMDYSPDTRFVEVYMKNTDDDLSFEKHFMGVYLLTEKIERDKNRIDIVKNEGKYKDISFIISRDKIKDGDIILRNDWNTLEDDFIVDQYNTVRSTSVFTTTYPSKNNMTDMYEKKIVDYINKFEYSLRSTKFEDPKIGYKNYIEVDSFLKYAMINEITKNIDGGEVSTYFYKNIGERMKAGPLWDFDQSMGNTSVEEVNEPTGFRIVDVIWFERLFQDENFADRYKFMYKNYRNTIWNDRNIDKLIDEAILELGPSIERNQARWYKRDTIEDYRQEIEELRSFLKERMGWMDKNIENVKRIKENAVE